MCIELPRIYLWSRNSSGVKWMRLSRQTSHVCLPWVSIGVMGSFFCFAQCDELAVVGDVIVAGAAGYPEHAQVAGLAGIHHHFAEVKMLKRGAEAAHIGEVAGLVDANGDGLEAAHRKPGDRMVVAAFRDGVLALDGGNNLLHEHL